MADSTSQSSSSSLAIRPLKRGRACMNCRRVVVLSEFLRLTPESRFLKIKCDGAKPVCGPCLRHPKDDDCEYNDGPNRSRTKALEDTVSRLEARLHELENPDASAPSVTLYDPYTPYPPPPPPGRLSIPSQFRHQHRTSQHSPEPHLAPLSPPSTTSSTPPLYFHGSSPAPLGIFDSHSGLSSGLDLQDPQLCDTLIQAFLPHARSFGFFLTLPLSDSLLAMSPALYYTLCAFGAHLSPSLACSEDRLIFRALQSLTTAFPSLSSPSSTATSPLQAILHAIQAEVLLAYYFWRTGVLLRARVHASSAGALVRGSGMHCARASASSGARWAIEVIPDAHALYLPATDEIDIDTERERERGRAVAAVFGLQSMLGVALDPVGELGPLSVPVPVPTSSIPDSAYLLVRAQSALYRTTSLLGHVRNTAGADIVNAFQALSSEVEEVRGLLPPRSVVAGPASVVHQRRRSYSPHSHSQSGSSGSGSGSASPSTYSSPRYSSSALALSPTSRYSSSASALSPSSASASVYSTPDYAMTDLPQVHAHAQAPSPAQRQFSYPRSPLGFSSTTDSSPDRDADADAALAHALLDGTSIRLHEVYSSGIYTCGYDPGVDVSVSVRVTAVRAATDLLRSATLSASATAGGGAPILGTLYAWAIRLLGEEISIARVRAGGAAGYEYDYEAELKTVVREALAAIGGRGGGAMMRWEVSRAGEAAAAALSGSGSV
ncbi:hypothetical protein MKEN_00967000 [Mycena kentingensis (nom. inval.)]|nr:hypothetical protein MKEN_00967000 [Mycena kentingensis (nom. inval.)]